MKKVHLMSLDYVHFQKIMNGTKTFEVRLYDEKRKNISKGDVVIFSSRTDENKDITLTALVLGLYVFPSFKKTFETIDPKNLGWETSGDYTQMYKYYSKKKELECGVLAIEIKTLHP